MRGLLVVVAALASACIDPPPPELPGGAAAVDPDAPVEVWAGKPVPALYRRGEVRGFEARQSGKLIGRSWGRYEGPVEVEGATLHRFSTRIELELPGRPPVRSEGEIFVDAQGELVSGFERSDAAELRFSVKDDTLRLEAGREHEDLSFPPGTAYMAWMVTLHEELMFGTRALETGDMQLRLVSLSGATPTEWEGHVVDRGGGKVEIDTNLGEVVELEEGRIRRIAVEADELVIDAMSPAPPWPEWKIAGPTTLRYETPADATFTLREVELPGRPGEPALFGEVLVPKGGGKGVPGVLFVAGSGLSDRYGFAGPPAVDLGSHEITDALGNAGFVVLRYDERGFGRSEDGALSWDGQLEDARRALRTLLVQPEVDPDRIILVGHGEGGWKAMRLVVERKGMCRGIALLASPGRRYREIIEAMAEATIQQLDPKARAEARKQHQALIDRLEKGEDAPAEFRNQAEWLQGILKEDPAKLVAKVDCPLWIAQGGKDFETDPDAEPQALVRAAKRAKKKVQVQHYPQLDHLFKLEPEASRPRRYLEDRRVDAKFLEDLSTWAKKRAR
jgi:pimeloyl-ACP methyl ester carboxylesterase